MPLVKPVTVQVTAGEIAEQVRLPGVDVTVYVVIAEPPVETGAVHETEAAPLAWAATVAVGKVGALETPELTAVAEAADLGLVPVAFEAVTVNVYAVPSTSPLTLQVVAVPTTAQVLLLS